MLYSGAYGHDHQHHQQQQTTAQYEGVARDIQTTVDNIDMYIKHILNICTPGQKLR